MADKKVEIRYDIHGESFDVVVGGESVANFNYDMHGSSAMSDAKRLVERLGSVLGFEVCVTEGEDSGA